MANSAVIFMGGGSRVNLTRKLLLWFVLVVQLFFIFCFWMLQVGFQDNITGAHGRRISQHRTRPSFNQSQGGVPKPPESRVHFVTKTTNYMGTYKYKKIKDKPGLDGESKFTRDFFELRPFRLINVTGINAGMLKKQQHDLGVVKTTWCFRQGTLNKIGSSDTELLQCTCRQYWHGKDCSQPEVIWRTLMLPGKQYKLRKPDKDMLPHQLYYMLEGHFYSLDLLELQVKNVDSVVDYYFIHWTSKSVDVGTLKKLQRTLNELIGPKRYMLHYCKVTHKEHAMNASCDTVRAYKYFTEQLIKLNWHVSETDLFLYSNESVIYSKEALKFLKYYATTEMPLWRFRLKHNVYGFYWQHPARTHPSGFLCSFGYLENFGDNLMTGKSVSAENPNVIGDLNHYGGWFCEFCQHPDEIIKELVDQTTQNSSLKYFLLPKIPKNRLIDSKYIEYLITQGTYIDGTTRLDKVRRYNDKYFAPWYTEHLKWKFGNILTNVFEAMENDYIIDEAEGGAGL